MIIALLADLQIESLLRNLSSPKLFQFKVAQMAAELIMTTAQWRKAQTSNACNRQSSNWQPTYQDGALSIVVCQKSSISVTSKLCSLRWKPGSRTWPLTAGSVKSWPKGVLRAHNRGNVRLWVHSNSNSISRTHSWAGCALPFKPFGENLKLNEPRKKLLLNGPRVKDREENELDENICSKYLKQICMRKVSAKNSFENVTWAIWSRGPLHLPRWNSVGCCSWTSWTRNLSCEQPPTLDLYDGRGNTTFIIFIAVIKIMIGVTFESISSCKRRVPIVCLALMLCLLQTRPVCWSKGWWLQMMAIWWFSGIRWRGRMNATVVVAFDIGRCRRANWGWSLFPCGKYLFVMTHLLPRTGH